MTKKRPSNTLVRKVNVVLATIWNPIGLLELEEDDAEYRSYANKIAIWLSEGVSEQKLSDHLFELERVSMGLANPNRLRATKSAKALLALIP